MANVEKKKQKLIDRINFLEKELKDSLHKKAAGPAISVPKYTSEIKELKNQLAKM